VFTEEQFYELYTPDEKARLYDAIGYQENEADLTLPKDVSERCRTYNNIPVHLKIICT
jgi:hypothetical protein